MKISYYIAKRYLFSKKSLNAINFISGISMLGVFVGSAALVIILSVFNGFESLVLSMYNTFTPEIRIEAAQGKTFDPHGTYLTGLKKDPRIASYVETLEEKCLMKYANAQYIGLVKGVSEDFENKRQLDSIMTEGFFTLQDHEENYAVIGAVAQNSLSVNLHGDFNYLEIYSPRKGAGTSVNPMDQFVMQSIRPAGVFEVQQEFDQMVFVPLRFARELMSEETQVSAIELSVQAGQSADVIKKEIAGKLGRSFVVKDRIQQNELLYKIFNSEKAAVFLILTFVLIIAIFNIIGSLTMLVMDKRKDIAILNSMGADQATVRKIFFTEGMMISMIGCVIGMFAGLIFCLLQQRYGFVKMDYGNLMTVNAYPIILKWKDFLLIFVTVGLISLIASSISARLSIKNAIDLKGNL